MSLPAINLADNFFLGTFPSRIDRHILAGVTKVNGVPAPKRVHLLLRGTNVVVASKISRSDGTWEIKGINEYPERSLTVIAFDDTGNYNAEIADFVSQVASS